MNAMSHEDAIATKAVERYLLRSMTDDERAIFEEHYFYCDDCTADLTDGTRMMIAGKSVAEEELEPAWKQEDVKPVPSKVVPIKRFQWVRQAAAASLVFALLGGAGGYRLAMWRWSEPPTGLIVRIDGIRRAGAAPTVPVVRPGDELRFDVEPSDDAASYEAVVTCGGKTESTHGISREMAADAVSLRIGELPAGRCELVVQGVRKDGKRFWITTRPFKVGER